MLQKIKSRNQEKEGTLFTDSEASGGEDRMESFVGMRYSAGHCQANGKAKDLVSGAAA